MNLAVPAVDSPVKLSYPGAVKRSYPGANADNGSYFVQRSECRWNGSGSTVLI
jgi:hypothetical protein